MYLTLHKFVLFIIIVNIYVYNCTRSPMQISAGPAIHAGYVYIFFYEVCTYRFIALRNLRKMKHII